MTGLSFNLTNVLRGENINRPHPKDAQTRVRGPDSAKGHRWEGRDLILKTASSKRHGSESGGQRAAGTRVLSSEPRGRAGSHRRRQTGRAALMSQVTCSRGQGHTPHMGQGPWRRSERRQGSPRSMTGQSPTARTGLRQPPETSSGGPRGPEVSRACHSGTEYALL